MINRYIKGFRIKGKARPRTRIATGKVGKPFAVIYMDSKYVGWLAQVSLCFGTRKFTCPIKIEIYGTVQIPKSWTKKKQAEMLGAYCESGGSVPDIDNFAGAVMDGIAPEVRTTNRGTGRKQKVPGTGDAKIARLVCEIRWWHYDSLCIKTTELLTTPEPWPWLEHKSGPQLF